MNFEETLGASSTVCLDAAVVKRIREERQLTQLYVSKVVGVTTDTISRWENNRYPTMRRENAIKLAEALDVPVSDLLLKPDVEEEVIVPQKKKSLFLPLLFIVSVLAVAVYVAVFMSAPVTPQPAAVTAERILPRFAGPGSTIPIQVSLTHRAKNSGVILREYFPKGWKIVQANPPASSLDNISGVARWIIKAGDQHDRIVYLVQVDPQAKINSETVFQGEIVASKQGNQSAVPVEGAGKISIARAHWADADGNGRIDDGEMLEASFTIEDMAGVHIDWDALEQLWDAGSYTWNAKKGEFVPEKL